MAEGSSIASWKIAGGLGCGMLFVSGLACAYGFSQIASCDGDQREEVYRVECAGGVWLTVDYAGTHNAMAGVMTHERFEVMYGEQRYGGARLRMDGEPMPEQYTWITAPYRVRGDGDEALHLFLQAPGLDRATEQSIEACLEDAPDALLAALEASPYDAPRGGSWLGRRRVYWSASPDDLVPQFQSGDRILQLKRDGAIWTTEPFGDTGHIESLVGYVRGASGSPRIDLDRSHPDFDFSGYLDAEGQTLLQRLGLDTDAR